MVRYSRGLLIPVLLAISCAILNAQNPAQEANNQKAVLDWYREVITFGHMDLAPKYMADNFIEHDPNISGGRKEFVAFYGKNPPRPIQPKLPSAPAEAFGRAWRRC